MEFFFMKLNSIKVHSLNISFNNLHYINDECTYRFKTHNLNWSSCGKLR